MTSNVALVLKCKIPRWDQKNLSSKVMLKNKWLDLVLDVHFITLSILNLMFFKFLEFIIQLRSLLKNIKHKIKLIYEYEYRYNYTYKIKIKTKTV
jgi:hypothetical protein